MEISVLDFVLTHALSYLLGLGTGLTICCRYKETFLQRARSMDDISQYNINTTTSRNPPEIINAEPCTITIT
tara:strand:+ start:340 stop:555 length:216 start_codon:yes stop_codon:yes gene_type:complete